MRQTYPWSTMLLLCGSALLCGCSAYKTNSHAAALERFSASLGEILPDEPPRPPHSTYKITSTVTRTEVYEGGRVIRVDESYTCVGETEAEEQACQNAGVHLGGQGWSCRSFEGGVTCSH